MHRPISRRRSISLGAYGLATLSTMIPPLSFADGPSQRQLPMSTIFKGKSQFDKIVARAVKENWKSKPINERMILFARALHGTRYVNFTLEIDDKIESPSVNLMGLDCWTFFETTLGLSRMIVRNKDPFSENDLLDEIQWTRYRGGICTGNYLERIHYLAEWFFENEARGNAINITRDLGFAEKVEGRRISEMTVLWRHYRYLRENPDLRAPMKTWENYVEKLPVYYIPKAKVAEVEPKLQNGDIIGIVTKGHGGFCSHVGLIIRSDDGVARFMHASRTYRRVVIDKSISGYLKSFRSHAGMMVGRPLEISETVSDPELYKKRLKELIDPE